MSLLCAGRVRSCSSGLSVTCCSCKLSLRGLVGHFAGFTFVSVVGSTSGLGFCHFLQLGSYLSSAVTCLLPAAAAAAQFCVTAVSSSGSSAAFVCVVCVQHKLYLCRHRLAPAVSSRASVILVTVWSHPCLGIALAMQSGCIHTATLRLWRFYFYSIYT